jgi:hypothetical protein
VVVSKSNAFETDLLELIFTAVALADLAENDTSSPATNLYVSLHTADPGEGGAQNTSECTYGSYARVAVARSGSGWTVASGSCSPVANIDFPAASSGTQTATHFAIGTGSSGAGYLMYSGTITPSISIAVGVTPRLSTASAIAED